MNNEFSFFKHITKRNLKHWVVAYRHDNALYNAVKTYARGACVDIGCGAKPYAAMLKPHVSQHIGIDHDITLHDKTHIDRKGTAYALPAEVNEFDTAICTSVLEHLEDTQTALQECFRVLKPGAHAIYTVPFIWHLHEEPRDFYRFTKYGLDYQFKKAGFEIVEINALSGFWVTWSQMLVYYIWRFHRGFMRYIPIIPVLAILIQAIGWLLEKLERAERWTWMYLVVARKPA